MIGITSLPLLLLLSSALAYTPCPIQGSDYPKPSGLADDPVFKEVLTKISQSLDNATAQSKALSTNLKANETSYSVVVFDAKSTLLSYHHTADDLALAPESVSKVTGTFVILLSVLLELTNMSQMTQSTASVVLASYCFSTHSWSRLAMTTGTGPSLISFPSLSKLRSPAQPKQTL